MSIWSWFKENAPYMFPGGGNAKLDNDIQEQLDRADVLLMELQPLAESVNPFTSIQALVQIAQVHTLKAQLHLLSINNHENWNLL